MEEVWKDIVGYEGKYQISNFGNVKSLAREYDTMNKFNRRKHTVVEEHMMKIQHYSNGYPFVGLSKDGKTRGHMIHRLVAMAFLLNPDNLPEVNHKDENKDNNCVDNLEWCTSKYNANYGTRNERCFPKEQCVAVNQYTKDGVFIKRWNSLGEVFRELGIDRSQISGVCRHKKEYVTAGGFKWEYAT